MAKRKGKKKVNHFERSNSINVAVNGISIPQSDGKLHRLMQHGTDSQAPFTGSKTAHRRSKSRERRKLDDFLEKNIEKSNHKKIGATPLNKFDDYTDVAVSADSVEPNENDQGEANVRSGSPGLQRRSDRLWNFSSDGKLAKATAHEPTKENLVTLSDESDEVTENDGLARSLQRLEEKLRNAKGLGTKFSPSSMLLRMSEEREGPPITERKRSAAQSSNSNIRKQTTSSILSPIGVSHVVETNVLTETPVTPCSREEMSRDGQSSSTIRRIERKGRRYKEVITVMAKSKSQEADEVQKSRRWESQNATLAMRDREALSDIGLKMMQPSSDHWKTQIDEKVLEKDSKPSFAPSASLSLHSSCLGKVNVADPEPLTLEGTKQSPCTGSNPTPNVLAITESNRDLKVETNVQARTLDSLRTNESSSKSRLSKDLPVMWRSPAFRPTIMSFRSSRTNSRNWRFGNRMSPNWLTKKSVENEASPSLDNAASVQSVSQSQAAHAQDLNDEGVCDPKVLDVVQVIDDGACKIIPLESNTKPKHSEKLDDRDDGTSLFQFPSVDSAERDLGDIFSFISSKKGSLDDEKATNAADEPVRKTSLEEAGNAVVERSSSPLVAEKTTMPSKKCTGTKKREKILSLLSGGRQRHFNGESLIALNSGALDHLPDLFPKRRNHRRIHQRFDKGAKADTRQNSKSQNQSAVGNHTTIPTKKGPEGSSQYPESSAIDNPSDLPSPSGVSDTLTQSGSIESNTMFDLGAIISGFCGPDRKCHVIREEDPPFAWRQCGGSRDDQSLSRSSFRGRSGTLVAISTAVTQSEIQDIGEGNLLLTQVPRSRSYIAPTGHKPQTRVNEHDEMNLSIAPQAAESIETVLQSQEKTQSRPFDLASRVTSLRGVLSSGNMSIANGTVFNVRITLSKLRGLKARCVRTNPADLASRPFVVGYARVEHNSSLAIQSTDVAKSRPLDLIRSRERSAKLAPIVWGSKSVIDKRRGTLYFSVVLKQRQSDDGPTTFAPETVWIVVGLEYGKETRQLGTAALTIDGTEVIGSRVSLPIHAEAVQERKSGFFSARNFLRNGAFHGERLSFGLEPDSFMTARLDVKVGDPEASGPSVWDDYGGDDASFDESINRSICEEPRLTEMHDSVEVVPLARGAAIITKQYNVERTESTTDRGSESIETVSTGRWIGPKKDEEPIKYRRGFVPLFRSRKKVITKDFPRSRQGEALKTLSPDTALDDEAERCNVEETVLSPISESRSECSLSDICSFDDESSDEESSSLLSRRRYNLTDKAADWVYRGAKAAGFFSYSSEEDKLTEFTFSKKDEVQMQTSDLSESEASEEPSTTLEGPLKFWIQTESLSSHEDRHSVNDTSTLATNTGDSASSHARRAQAGQTSDLAKNTSSLEQFKKILMLAQKLNVSPYELIKRMENGETFQVMQKDVE